MIKKFYVKTFDSHGHISKIFCFSNKNIWNNIKMEVILITEDKT